MSKRTPYQFQEPSADTPLYWRSLDEKERLFDPKMYEERQVEFTPEQLERPEVGRRGFMSLMGASMALAGAAGCRRPVEKIVPYAKMPEEVVPGVPSYYATVYARRGDAIGLLVESHEGRPTKVEGNAEHSSSFGGTDLITQASILDMYDPDRSGEPLRGSAPATWDEVDGVLKDKLKAFEADAGAGLRFLAPPSISPSFLRLRAAVARRFPKAQFHSYEAVADSNARAGSVLAFGIQASTLPFYDKAQVILSLDSDFLQTETGSVRATKLFSRGRRLRSQNDRMSRLYVVEPSLTTTGANADHRLRLPAGQVKAYALALAAELATRHGVDLGELTPVAKKLGKADGVPAPWIAALAKDLASARRRSIIVAGSRQPAEVHALVFALNQGLGNVGSTVQHVPFADPSEPNTVSSLKELVADMKARKVETLVMLGGNPVYDAPADLDFAEALGSVATSLHLSSHVNETSEKSTWHLPSTHEYESWGDQRSLDGTVTVQQPMIAPLKPRRSALEILAVFAGTEEKKGYDIVRATLRDVAPGAVATTHTFRRVLRDGLVANNLALASAVATGMVRTGDVVAALEKAAVAPAPSKDALEVSFAPCPKLFDGRYANNGWLLELPDPITKIVWDNAALLSPTTAKELGVKGGDLVNVTVDGASVKVAAWVFPGQADNVVSLTLGWGRTKAGRVGTDKGFNVYPLRKSTTMGFASGAKVATTGERYIITQTQEHDSMEGRPIAREASLATYQKKPNFPALQAPPPAKALPLWHKADYSKGHKWGMTIDLNACTGCNACTMACQAENNIHLVGKEQVSKGREMAWLRIDRYFVGDAQDPQVAHQPVACVQCEEAPCENVCPVNATAHSPEGLNDMAYNRCIGTRYCANNCPYKVRRFNYLDWKSEFWNPHDLLGTPVDPPDTIQMQYNPDVTVRMRGVMEKCTYCVQRIQRVKIDTKREGRGIRDGEITPACAQACPADAIVFGDLNDPSSRVAKLANLDRKYRLLEDLGTSPRTTYLGKVRNLNDAMAEATAAEKHG